MQWRLRQLKISAATETALRRHYEARRNEIQFPFQILGADGKPQALPKTDALRDRICQLLIQDLNDAALGSKVLADWMNWIEEK